MMTTALKTMFRQTNRLNLPSTAMMKLLAVACLVASTSLSVQAADLYWAGDIDNDWDTNNAGDTNWSTTAGSNTNSTSVPDNTSNVHFGTSGGASPNTTLGAGFEIDRLFIDTGTSGIAINTTSANELRFQSHSTDRTIVTVAGNTGDHVFTGTDSASGTQRHVRFGANSGITDTFDIGANASFEFAARVGQISSSGNYEKTGDGTLILSANNGGSGGWNFSSGTGFAISEGTLQLANNGTSGNSGNDYIVASGATLQLNNANYGSTNGDLTLNGSGFGGAGALNNLAGDNTIGANSGQVVLASGTTIRVTDSLTIHQNIEGSGSLTKRSSGVLILTATNGYTGSTTIGSFGGTILVNGTHTTGGLYRTLTSSGFLGGDGTIGGAGDVDLTADNYLIPGAALNTIGSLTIDRNLNLDGILRLDVSGAAIDQVLGIDTLTFGATSELDIVGSLTAPTYTIMTYSTRSGILGDISALPGSYEVVYDDTLGEVRLEAMVPEPSSWMLIAMGLGGLLFLGYRRRSQAAESFLTA